MQARIVVRSLAGRDAGDWFAVIESDADFALIVNGKSRPLERPKRKRKKHLAPTAMVLPEQAFAGNRALRKALTEVGAHCEEGGK